MGLFDFLKKKETKEFIESVNILAKEPNAIYQPITGNVIKLEDIPDPVFSSGALGEGSGIEPTEEIVYAPIDATISTIADTKHAIGFRDENGLEMLIHVGIDTVNMNGTGFKPLVQEGDKVKAGQPILKFSKDAINKAGYSDTTAVLVINSTDFGKLLLKHLGLSKAGELLFKY